MQVQMNASYEGLPGLLCLDCYRTSVNKYLFSTYWHQKPPMIQKMKRQHFQLFPCYTRNINIIFF